MRGLVFAAIVLTGCGDDPDTTCDPIGFADGESIVAGEALGPFARAALVVPEGRPFGVAFALAFDEGEGTCGEPGIGRRISVLFCDTPVAKAYEVVTVSAFRCPNEGVMAIAEDATGADLADAVSGVVTVSYAGGCVAGAYELELGGAMIEGAFDAVVCPLP